MKRKAGRRSWHLIVLGVAFLLAVVAYLCLPYAPRTGAELCGNYVLDCQLVHEELTLASDGTFTQRATIKPTGEVISSKGKWTYETNTRHSLFGRVHFYSGSNEGFLALLKWPNELKPDYAQQTPGGASLPAKYWLGRLTLGGTDSWPYWKKVK
jgi:hypothetical protein